MPKQNVYMQAFSNGVVDPANLARVDLERMRLAAEDQTNFLCTTTGNMFFRPGTEYLGSTYTDAAALTKEFIFGSDDAALMEFTDSVMRVWVDDAVVTRPAVTASVSQGLFAATGSWVLSATDGATATIASGRLNIKADAKGSQAYGRQEVTVNEANVEHAIRLTITRGPVSFRIGSTASLDDYVTETELKAGTHSLAFTPTGASFWINIQTNDPIQKRVTECYLESAGVMTLPTPWVAASLSLMRFAQSADVVFTACEGVQPRRIERRGTHSWSIVEYQPNDGPFGLVRTAPVRLNPSTTFGNGTLTSSRKFFTADHVGALFRLFHTGQVVEESLAGDYEYTTPIKVTGLNTDSYGERIWHYTIAGTWNGTLRVQRSFDGETYGFQNYRKSDTDSGVSITGNVANEQQNEDDDNAIVYYRIGFNNSHTSGTANISIDYEGGGGFGICRVVAYNSNTNVDIEILKPFKNITATNDWLEGEWSDSAGWPSSVALAEGRLFWAGNNRFWGSVSDAYESFDEELEGDAAPISRSVAINGAADVQWMLGLQRVVFGTNGSEVTAKSSSIDEPLTTTNMTLKSSSTVGAAPIDAVKIDGRGLFVDRSTKAIFELIYSGETGDYISAELTRLCASWFSSGIVHIAVQRRPDTRVWVILADGTAMCIVYEPAQEVVAFIPIETDGLFERVSVLPGVGQDDVYFVVKRTINSATKRFIEKMAKDSEAKPGNVAKVMDCFKTGTGLGSATITGLTHLIGESVKVWADGAPITEVVNGFTVPKLYTVSGAGEITLSASVNNYCVGLAYDAAYKSARLAYGAAGGTAMLQKKRVPEIGVILTDYVRSGIRYGQEIGSTDRPMFPLPVYREGTTATEVVSDIVHDEDPVTFDGIWTTDARVCLTAEWPVNFLGLVISVDTNG